VTRWNALFQPLQIGPVRAKNRFEVAPTLVGMANLDGSVSAALVDYCKAKARGGAGIVTVGESSVDAEYAMTHSAQLTIDNDNKIFGLGRIANAIHRYGALASIELCHGGGQTIPALIGGRSPIAPSVMTSKFHELLAGHSIAVREMDRDLIEQVIENFAAAALRVKKAGFDMILVHGGHGWLLAQFTSPLTNKRVDEYGGSLENRARFPLRVLERIREVCGPDLAIEYRMSVDELVSGGLSEEEGVRFARLIEEKVDCFQASCGTMGEPRLIPYTHPAYFLPEGQNVRFAAVLKQAVSKPVTAVGGIVDLDLAERVVTEGSADMVAMARALIADPGLPNKGRRGLGGEVVPCIRCNECMATLYSHRPLRCTVNPLAGLDTEYPKVPRADSKQKVVVVGGGPAGLEAAKVAAERGHQVVLFEKHGWLGGNLFVASRPPFKAEMKRFLDYLVSQIEAMPIDVRLGTSADPGTIRAECPDHLVVAVGAEPARPDIRGIGEAGVVWAGDAFADAAEIGDRVVVAGGGGIGCEAALHLARKGKKVTVVEMLDEAALDFNFINRGLLLDLLVKEHVDLRTGSTVIGFSSRGVTVAGASGAQEEINADTVVLSLGMRPRDVEAEAFRGLAPWVHVVGDCVRPRLVVDAVLEGFYAAVEM
jgi:2,4-dienoyl-CoA reductase-like NADH-dependent reductase (Old Yellow Enzyme family)/thioredoxin reductase